METKVYVITGTGRGIGRAMAEHYLGEGHIVCGCSRGEPSVTHERYRHFMLDVADEKAVVSMVRKCAKEFGRIDILLNNAGIASMNHILTTPAETVSKVFSTNVLGTFVFMRECAKLMVRKKSGNIVNFATVAAPLRLEGEAAYASSKAAVVSLTEIASRELAEFGIRVNAVGPTPVKTDLIKGVDEQKMQSLINRQAIKRYGTFDDIINAVDFFTSEASSFITGQILYLGGVNG